jgi:hypothetical protein
MTRSEPLWVACATLKRPVDGQARRRHGGFDAPRFTTPILTVRDVAQLVGMPIDTAQAWAGQRKDWAQLFTRITPLPAGASADPAAA